MSVAQNPLSSDLIWAVTRNNNSFLVKRQGMKPFSRDPLNLTNKHSRKYVGYANAQAIGIQPDSNTIAVTTKTSKQNQPAKLYHTSSYSASTPSRKLYKNIVNSTAKKGYRADLRAEAVSRASAIRASQRENKKERNAKPRSAKHRKQQQEAQLTAEN